MKTEHIPGPWHHDEYGHIYAGPYIIGETFEFEDIDGYGKEEALANTRLMAAAPDLLYALRELYMAGLTFDRIPYYKALRIAKELIEKIEGDE